MFTKIFKNYKTNNQLAKDIAFLLKTIEVVQSQNSRIETLLDSVKVVLSKKKKANAKKKSAPKKKVASKKKTKKSAPKKKSKSTKKVAPNTVPPTNTNSSIADTQTVVPESNQQPIKIRKRKIKETVTVDSVAA